HLHLTAEQRQELQRVSRQAVGRVALRAHMALLSDRGYSVPQIATIHHCGQDVVRIWLHRYKEKGVTGLEDEPRSGRPPQDPLAQGVGHLLFLDECDLHLLPVVRAMWMKGPRVRVPTPGTNARRAFFGALDAASGCFHTTDQARKLAVHFVEFLQHLADAYPT